MTQDVDRSVVTLGVDYRPIPINLGDGVVWQFDPDPSPSKFNQLTKAVKALGPVGKKMSDAETEDDGTFERAMTGLKDALGALLLDKDQRKKWAERDYGFRSMNALVGRLMEEITGFTEASPSGSGKG